MKKITQCLLLGILTFLTSILCAQTPRSFTYQGMLVDAAKKPVTGTHQILVNLYDDPVNGTLLHSENFSSQIADGIFSIVLGSTKPLDSNITFNKQYWLGITIDGGTELSPRTTLSSAPYAMNAAAASSLTNSSSGAILKSDDTNNLISYRSVNPAWPDSLDLGSASAPWRNLYVDPLTLISSGAGTTKWYLTNTPSGFIIPGILPVGQTDRFRIVHLNQPQEWFTIQTNGNVGIGVPSPTSKLDVLGDIKFSKELRPGGSAGTAGQILTSSGIGIPPTWQNPPAAAFVHYIGELFGGGIIFYLYKDASGVEHGLIASLADLGTNQVWSNSLTLTTALSTWDGMSNSNSIQSSSPAANLCRTYMNPTYTDWYLPSMDELFLLFEQSFIINKILGPAGALANADYWSSTDYNANSAIMRGFGTLSQNQGSYPKNTGFYVRAVRAF